MSVGLARAESKDGKVDVGEAGVNCALGQQQPVIELILKSI